MSSTTSDVKIRILLVDDEPDILLTISSVLSGRGHYVKTFDKPAAAVEHLASEATQYDLVITDYRMPGGLSGLDFAKRIKKGTGRMKIFLMTAFDLSSSAELGEALKLKIVDETIQKPISNDKLVTIIERSFLHNNH